MKIGSGGLQRPKKSVNWSRVLVGADGNSWIMVMKLMISPTIGPARRWKWLVLVGIVVD